MNEWVVLKGIVVDMPNEMLCTVGLDSKVKCWKMENDHMQVSCLILNIVLKIEL